MADGEKVVSTAVFSDGAGEGEIIDATAEESAGGEPPVDDFSGEAAPADTPDGGEKGD
jgi:hypothetical protein